MQKEYSTSTILLSVVVSFSVGMSCNSKLIIADSDDIIIIDDTISDESDEFDEDIKLSGNVLAKPTLDCYPQINEATLGRNDHPKKGTEFSCGDTKFLVSSYSQEYSDLHLGGFFPVTKMLSQIGCRLEEETLLCREEKPMHYLHGSVITTYREIVAQVISTSDD